MSWQKNFMKKLTGLLGQVVSPLSKTDWICPTWMLWCMRFRDSSVLSPPTCPMKQPKIPSSEDMSFPRWGMNQRALHGHCPVSLSPKLPFRTGTQGHLYHLYQWLQCRNQVSILTLQNTSPTVTSITLWTKKWRESWKNVSFYWSIGLVEHYNTDPMASLTQPGTHAMAFLFTYIWSLVLFYVILK